VLPQGALFRSGVEGQIRQNLLKADLVEAVIGLAPNHFYGTGLTACVLARSWPAVPDEEQHPGGLAPPTGRSDRGT
jgi:type I restriction-modification system DNA methylase subunit